MIKTYTIIRLLIIFLISINLLLISTTTYIADETKNIQPTVEIENDHQPSLKESRQQVSKLYSKLIPADESNIHTIKLNGLSTDIAPLPTNSNVIELPKNRFVYQSPTQEIQILPDGTQITYHNTQPILLVPGEAIGLEVSNLKQYSINNLINSTTFKQTIDQLNEYSFTLTLHEFTNPTIAEYTNTYTIDWGDSTKTTYHTPSISHNHNYNKSGQYFLTLTISDIFGYNYSVSYPYNIEYEGHLVHTYLIIEDNKEPAAVTTTTGIGTLTLILIALTESGKYKFLAFLLPILIPMYTRISKEDVLDQFVRGQIFGFIKTNPGVHYNQIRREIDVKNGTLSYHLRVLEKTELIKSRREGIRYRAFYPTGMKFPQNERFRLTELQIKILNNIKNNPGITQREIARQLHKKPQTVNYNIKVLEHATLIKVHHNGRKTGLYAIDSDAEIQSIGQ
jgi:DNA-binding MarR family transcriptional regulator